MAIIDYQPVIDDLMSTARDLSQVVANDNDIQLAVSYVAEKFHAIKQSVHQQRQSLDLLPCVSSQDVSHVTLSHLVIGVTFYVIIISVVLLNFIFIIKSYHIMQVLVTNKYCKFRS